jgi:hypothetical protein
MSARPYRDAMPIDRPVGSLQKGRGTEFWLDAVDALAIALVSRSPWRHHGRHVFGVACAVAWP